MTEMEISILDELDELLDLERAAILKGDIEKVGRVVDTKQRLLDLLSKMTDPQEEPLARVRQKLVRNQKLLDESLNGIKAVSQRLAEARMSRETLETYDSLGQRRKHIFARGRKVERRA